MKVYIIAAVAIVVFVVVWVVLLVRGGEAQRSRDHICSGLCYPDTVVRCVPQDELMPTKPEFVVCVSPSKTYTLKTP